MCVALLWHTLLFYFVVAVRWLAEALAGAGRQIAADFLWDGYFLFRGAHPFFICGGGRFGES